jgi:hypothetical protein
MGDLPWAREVLFQTIHSASRFLSLSNNLGNLLLAPTDNPMAASDGFFDTVLIRSDGVNPSTETICN